LPEDVLALDAVGHTPGHTVFRKGDLLITGDLMHALDLQLKYPEYCANFDGDKEKAVKSRKKILEYAKDNKLTICGMHLPY
ncbi:MAG: MBL fold metallo-hydrolase, partial [Bacteroidales bacterium]|nr:MBL fold metallo-hydrolase [Bacteroidales bacterium]